LRNLEIKARTDDLKRLHNIAANLGAAPGGKHRQVDTYFKTPNGRLKLRESSMTGNELIAYFRPDGTQAAECEYERLRVQDATRLKKALERTIGISVVVVKDRELYRLNNVRIHLDEVEKLGDFIELEVELDEMTPTHNPDAEIMIRELIQAFDIKPEDMVECSYADLLSRHGEV